MSSEACTSSYMNVTTLIQQIRLQITVDHVIDQSYYKKWFGVTSKISQGNKRYKAR